MLITANVWCEKMIFFFVSHWLKIVPGKWNYCTFANYSRNGLRKKTKAKQNSSIGKVCVRLWVLWICEFVCHFTHVVTGSATISLGALHVVDLHKSLFLFFIFMKTKTKKRNNLWHLSGYDQKQKIEKINENRTRKTIGCIKQI